MSRGTTARNVRVPDDVWDAAKIRADIDGTTVSAVVLAFLRQWSAAEPPRDTVLLDDSGREWRYVEQSKGWYGGPGTKSAEWRSPYLSRMRLHPRG